MTWSSDWLAATEAANADTLADEWVPAALTQTAPGTSASMGTDAELERRADARRAAQERQAELEEMYQRGLEDGATEVMQRDAKLLHSALDAVEAAAAQIVAGERMWAQTVQENVCALAIAVARHIIGRELKGDPHVVADLARKALANFPVDEGVRVRLHPEDLSILTLATSEDGNRIPVAPGRDVTWIADADVQPGGCIVEGRNRVIDGRVDHALERVYMKLADAG
jgi:flagellar biosynthesis/type III secretory pathway protein FliH